MIFKKFNIDSNKMYRSDFKIQVSENNNITFECYTPTKEILTHYEDEEVPAYAAFRKIMEVFIKADKKHSINDYKRCKTRSLSSNSVHTHFDFEDGSSIHFDIFGPFENYGSIRASQIIEDILGVNI
jgi:hypothetical protein